MKLVGANFLVLVLVLVVVGVTADHPWGTGEVIGIVLAAAALHLVLVLIALQPIRDLESVASRVWEGDLGARVAWSAVADRHTVRLGTMLNTLLDSLVADRAKMRALAIEVIAAGDRERAALARELHDSTAQRLAALILQLSVAARDSGDPVLTGRLEAARDSAAELTEEVRLLSHTLHPRVLDDLGLAAALQKLGRELAAGSGVAIEVSAPPGLQLPRGPSSVLFRVAQEAVGNAVRHASPRRVALTLCADEAEARLEVCDDGAGFDRGEVDRQRRGMGLLSMRERVALVYGRLEIRTTPGAGTTVVASVPLTSAPDADFRRVE